MVLSRQLQADLSLVLVTLIWGSTFVVVKNELASVQPLTFIAVRFAFAFAAMLLLARGKLWKAGPGQWAAGGLIGIFLFSGYAFQTVGLRYTTASKAAFITGLSVVLAPLLARLLLRQSPTRQATAGVGLATTGLALLSLRFEDLGLKPEAGLLGPQSLALGSEAWGDLLVLGCAVSFALHIVTISRFAPRMDGTVLATVQIGVVTVAGAGGSLLLEPMPATLGVGTLAVAAALGLTATAFAFTVQNRAQAFTTPTHTALVFSLEPVFGGLFGYLLAGERLSEQQILGCGLMLAGMVVAEVRRGGEEDLRGDTKQPQQITVASRE